MLTALVTSSVAPNSSPGLRLAKGQLVPDIRGMTLDGQPFDLASLRGRPVIVHFWGPSCAPCRDEFALFLDKLRVHETDRLAIVGVLMFDAPAPALAFIRHYGATWPTVADPTGAIRTAYRVAARPQSYFIDRNGILRSIQVGQLLDSEFERQYALIGGAAAASDGAAGTVGTPSPLVEIPTPP